MNVNGAFFSKYELQISYFCVLLLLLISSFLILNNANWIFDLFWADDYQLLFSTAIGRPSHSYTGSGRFWPLGLCDYSLLLAIPFGTTVKAHFLYNCTTMIVACLLLFSTLRKIVRRSYIALFCMPILFLSSSFILIHMSCIYPERQMFLMLCTFLFFYYKASHESNHFRDYAIAFLSAVYTTYLKEPVFGLWLAFACSNLIFGNLKKNERKFNYSLIINSLIWICIYVYRTIYRDRTLIDGLKGYGAVSADSSVNVISNFVTFFQNDHVLYIFSAIAVIRLISILQNKESYNSCTDGVLFAGLSYAGAFLLLNMGSCHYFFPTIVLSLPAMAVAINQSKRFCLKYIIAILIVICSFCSANVSSSWIHQISMLRVKDHALFLDLIQRSKLGNKILWITDKENDQMIENSRKVEQMKFRRYQIFFDYYSGAATKGSHFPFVMTSDYSQITAHTIIICSDETLNSECGKAIMNKIDSAGLSLMLYHKDIGAKVFAKN